MRQKIWTRFYGVLSLGFGVGEGFCKRVENSLNEERFGGLNSSGFSVCLDTNEKLKLFYYSAYFCYYLWAP